MSRKISSYDKLQALKRNPNYINDYNNFVFWCRENEIDEDDYEDSPETNERAKELCSKYGIKYPFNPAMKIIERQGSAYIEGKEIVEVVYPQEVRDLNQEELKEGFRPKYLPIPVFDNEEFLIVKIDLRADKEVILSEFKETVDYFHYFASKSNSRLTRERKVDKWEIWDAYNRTKSFEKTVQRINSRHSLFAELLSIEPPAPIGVATARKAYYRAFEQVFGEPYSPEKHNLEKLPIRLKKKCEICAERSTCQTLCPDVLSYVAQDKGSGDFCHKVPLDEYLERYNPSNKNYYEDELLDHLDSPSNGLPE